MFFGGLGGKQLNLSDGESALRSRQHQSDVPTNSIAVLKERADIGGSFTNKASLCFVRVVLLVLVAHPDFMVPKITEAVLSGFTKSKTVPSVVNGHRAQGDPSVEAELQERVLHVCSCCA